jgi:small subunit ribosomal protein S17
MYTRRKSQVGVVVSDKMQKTVVVAIETHKRHPLYKKTVRRTTRYKAHDEKELAKVGDLVRIIESRPLSREKRWRLVEVILSREVAEMSPGDIDAAMLGTRHKHTDSAAAKVQEAIAAEAVAEAEAIEETAKSEVEAVAEEAPAASETVEPDSDVEAASDSAVAEIEAEVEPPAASETVESDSDVEAASDNAVADSETETSEEEKTEE